MPELPHLILPRAEVDLDRRKRPGFGQPVQRNPVQQTARLRQAVDDALATHARLRTSIIDPALIVRVRTTGALPEDEWLRAGLVVLGHDETGSVVLFASDADLTEFRARLMAYSEGAPAGQKNPQYNSLIASIEEFGPLRPEDKIGSGLKGDGFEGIEAFALVRDFRLDVELWEFGTQAERLTQADRIGVAIAERSGEITDRYVGISFTALRVVGTGAVFRWLLEHPLVRVLDFPPEVDLDVAPMIETTVRDLGAIDPPEDDAPLVAILDSGVNNAHPLLEPVVVDRVAVPASLGLSDLFGHGSRVSGIAAYGDLRAGLERGSFQSSVRILSGKIVNDQGNLDDSRLVASQVDEVVRELHGRGCRIFNLSLGDRQSRYNGGKVGQWTAVLDELARELDVLFVVAAGNYEHQPANGHAEEHLTGYPGYLLTEKSRIFEPATAANALTVGAVAHVAAVRDDGPGFVGMRPIADVGEPAPFTCCGPGVNNAQKPDLCDDGGNQLYDGALQRLIRSPESEIVTTHHRYLERLFTTAFGTSYAAPLVTHKAALVLQAFPGASANLLRALLANSARIPDASVQRLQGMPDEAIKSVCGYGLANAEIASTSDTNRVVLYAEDEIGMDRFFVYEVPIPADFSQVQGERSIRVTLAFDPPTRHSRAAYLGVEMSFRLVRGKTLEEVREHYRRRNREQEGPYPELEVRYDCKLDFGSTARERGTLQRAALIMRRNPAADYGETYYLVVRCERQWFADEFATQRFAVVVELSHSQDIRLYERVRERVRVRIPAS